MNARSISRNSPVQKKQTKKNRRVKEAAKKVSPRRKQPLTRIERDTMGELHVPSRAYYGVQTARAIENFPISGLRFPRLVSAAPPHA